MATRLAKAIIPVITVQGSPFSRGEQAGALLSSSLEAVLCSYESRLLEWANIPRTDVEQIGLSFKPALERVCGDGMEYLAGVAAGSGQPLGRLLATVAAYDLWMPPRAVKACTSIAWRSPDEDVWIAQTFDWFSDLSDHIVVIRAVDENGETSSLGLAESALPWLTNMNRHGLAVTVNALTGFRRDGGVPARGMVALASGSTSVSDWKKRVGDLRPVAPLHLMLADSSGEIAGAELDSEQIFLREPESNALIHTNHFIYAGTPDGLEGMLPDDLDESSARHNLAGRLVAAKLEGSADPVSAFKEIFSTHDPDRYPRTLCCHPTDEFGPLARAATLAAIIFQPRTLRTWLCAGNPCDSEFAVVPWEPIDRLNPVEQRNSGLS